MESLGESRHRFCVHKRNKSCKRDFVHDTTAHEIARRTAGDASHEVVACHVEQPLGDFSAGDIIIHAVTDSLNVEWAFPKDVLPERVLNGVYQLSRRDTGLR